MERYPENAWGQLPRALQEGDEGEGWSVRAWLQPCLLYSGHPGAKEQVTDTPGK